MSKRMVEANKLVEPGKMYDVAEAIDLALKMPKAKFDETLEMHIRLGVDGKQADQQVRGVVVLPNGTGKTKKVLVLAKGDPWTKRSYAKSKSWNSYNGCYKSCNRN